MVRDEYSLSYGMVSMAYIVVKTGKYSTGKYTGIQHFPESQGSPRYEKT
jgi:hypothetical protein